jgi:hypothetical protein
MQPPGTVPPPPAGGEPAVTPLPWEQPGYPALEGLYETAKLVLTSPGQAFARMSPTGSLGRPLLYAVIFGWVGIIAGQAYNIAFRSAMQNLIPGMNRGFHLPLAVSITMMVLAPLFVLIGVFVWSAIVHLFLMLVGGATTGFASTVRVVCYAGTVQVLQIVPFCGWLIGFVWAMFLYIIGLAIAHRTTQGKAAVGALGCPLTCCACATVATIGAIALGFSLNVQHISDALRHLAGQ